MKKRLSYLEQSGIYYFWKRYAAELDDNKPFDAAYQQVSLDSNVVLIFYVILCLYLIISVIFSMERFHGKS